MNKLSVVYRTLCPLLLVVGCGGQEPPQQDDPDGDFQGIEEAAQGLTDLSSECTYTASSNTAVLALATGDVALVSKLSSGALGINGFPCGAATTATLKKLSVTGTAGAQTVIIDFMGGMWGVGTANGVGIDVDLGGGAAADPADALKIRGTKTADKIVFGATGITTNADSFKDITYANVSVFVVTMSDGDDSFSGAGSSVVGGAFTSALTVYGGAGNDTLQGGTGDDTLNGGDGNDTFVAAAGADGNDVLVGGNGTDIADYSARTNPVRLAIDGMADSGDTGGLTGAMVVAVETDTIGTDIETLKGGSGNDTLIGSPNADTIFGGPGDDYIVGGLGADTLSGDAGNDTFYQGSATSGADVITGGTGTDTIDYSGRTNSVTVNLDGTATSGESGEHAKVASDVENVVGGMGDDMINGSAANNVLDGGPGNDTIFGGAGNDILRGGAGNNSLHGDAGDDTFDEGASALGNDTIFGGAGTDTVDYSGRTNAVTVVMDGVTAGGETGEADVIGTDVENLIGGAGADFLTGNAADNVIEGRGGVDTINGMAGDDTIDGGGDADIIDCGAGDADILLSVIASGGTSVNCEL